MATATEDFFRLVHAAEPQSPVWIIERFRHEAPRLVFSTLQQSNKKTAGPDCMLTDVGVYLLTMMQALSTFGSQLVHGDIPDHLTSRAEDLVNEDDLNMLGHLDDTHALLRRIDSVLLNATQQCLLIWQGCPELPASISSAEKTGLATEFYSASQMSNVYQPSSSSYHDMDPVGNQRHTVSSAMGIVTESEPVSTEGDARAAEPEGLVMDSRTNSLKKRGIGKYYCRHGLSCAKGGVTSSGTLKEFNRNSDFRTHMQKHEKLFKCDLPNCTNKTGFARIDQLERHKLKAKHSPLIIISHNPP